MIVSYGNYIGACGEVLKLLTLKIELKDPLNFRVFLTASVVILCSFLITTHIQAQGIEATEFVEEADDVYRSIASQEIPREAFMNAYTGFYTLKGEGKISSSPLITFVNFSIPSNRTRLFVVDINSKTIVFSSKVAHGKNSGSVASPATNFSNIDNSLQSSLGFYLSGETYSGKHGYSLRLDGLSPGLNTNARNRDIVIHAAPYAEGGGRSYGCLALPPQNNNKIIELLKNKTLIFTFTSSAFAKLGDKNAAVMASTNKNFDTVPNVAGVQPEFPEYTSIQELSTAPPTIGELGQASGVTILEGTPKYQECQKLSNKSWAETVKGISSGLNPSTFFTGSWTQLKNTIEVNEIENDNAINLSKQRLSEINDCVAIAHISTDTDFSKKEINKPEIKTSKDGKIKCTYNTPESQDYGTCTKCIEVYEDISLKEKNLHQEQENNLSQQGVEDLKNLNINNAQEVSLKLAQKSSNTLSSLTGQRAEISNAKINALSAVASKIPTKDFLFDKCQENFNKHGVVSVSEFTSFVKLYSSKDVIYQDSNKHCLNAISASVNPIQNDIARSQIKDVLKGFGKELLDYESKADSFKNQLTGQLNTDQSVSIESIKFNESDNFINKAISSIDDDLNLQNNFSINENNEHEKGRTTSKGFDSENILLINEQVKYLDLTSGSYRAKPGLANTNQDHNGNDGVIAEGTGIFDSNFYYKIKIALEHPEKLEELKLTKAQMKEYLAQKTYFDSLKSRVPSSATTFTQSKLSIHQKELNIFDIISKKYQEVFRED